MIPLARIAVWGLSLGAAILIVLILGHSGTNEDVNSKVFAAVILFVIFSISSLPGLFLIERRPHLTVLGGMTIGLSVAAFFVALDTFLSGDLFARNVSVENLAIIALASGQASMLLAFKREDDTPLVEAVVRGSLLLLALLVILVIVEISSPGTDIGRKTFAIVSVLYLLGALLPPFLRWEEAEQA